MLANKYILAHYEEMKACARTLNQARDEIQARMATNRAIFEDINTIGRGRTSRKLRESGLSYVENGMKLAAELGKLAEIILRVQQVIESTDSETAGMFANVPDEGIQPATVPDTGGF